MTENGVRRDLADEYTESDLIKIAQKKDLLRVFAAFQAVLLLAALFLEQTSWTLGFPVITGDHYRQ